MSPLVGVSRVRNRRCGGGVRALWRRCERVSLMDSALETPSPNTGRSILRNEDPLFLTGQAKFLADLTGRELEGAAHVVFVRSVYAHAKIVSVDVSEVLAASGVLCVISAADEPVTPTGPYAPFIPDRFTQPFVAEGHVRYVGEAIAAVVAETFAQAVDAAEQVVVTYKELTPVVTLEDAAKDPANTVLTAAGLGTKTPHDPERFDQAEVVVKQRFVNPRQVAAPIECRAVAASWSDDGHLHYWASTQRPHRIRDLLAEVYKLPTEHIHAVAGPFVGGGFGGKGTPGPEEIFVPHLARVLGRPVRWTETRTENLTAAVQGRGEEVTVWLAGSSDGKFGSIRVEITKDAGAYPSAGAGLPDFYSQPMLTGTYDIDHVEFDSVTLITNRPPVAALRGAGRAPLIAALERAVDIYASQIDMDPAELRRINLIQPGQMPFLTRTGATYDEANYGEALDRALDKANYLTLRADQAARRASSDCTQLGIGIASFNHKTAGGGTEQAIVKINCDGSATVITGTTSQGHGHATAWAQITSDELGIPIDQIQVIEGVTDEIATGVGAIGSRSLQVAGMAIHNAAQDVVEQSRILASELMEAAVNDVVLDKARCVFHVAGTPSRSVSWVELAVASQERNRELGCDFTYDPDGKDVYPSGCHIAVVEVDTETGSWKVSSYVAVDDAGVRVNPMIVDGQLHGGIALGIAQVLGEEVVHDANGQPLTSTFMDYPIASIDQFCQFELEAQIVPSSFNVYGYKAVGESGPIGATPAVHNAVIDAVSHLGVTHIDLPVTPEKVWNALAESR